MVHIGNVGQVVLTLAACHSRARSMNVRAFLLVCSVSLLACGGEAVVDASAQDDATSQQSLNTPVRLLWAATDSTCVKVTQFGSCENDLSQAVARGRIEVESLGLEKRVAVRYQKNDGTWGDVLARYVGPSRPGAELWSFETEPKTYSSRLGTEFPFAVSYTVNGQTYWDNNGNRDYRLGGGPRTFSPSFLLANAPMAVLESRWQSGRLSGQVVLKNLAFEKQLRVRYSTDGWRTAKEVFGAYQYTTSVEGEYWSFAVDLDPNATRVDFALAYTANGTTYWDNNASQNYSLTKN
jgi:hypothetical protein